MPVFNEARFIRGNLDLLLGELRPTFPQFEVIVVSDGSTDGTDLTLNELNHPDVRPILLNANVGKGAAIRAGLATATGDYVLIIDGGMEIHPKEIRVFMGLMELYGCDVVLGSKRHPQSKVYYPWYRKFLSYVFQLLVRGLFDVDVTDTQVGIKLFRREVVAAIVPDLRVDRYGFDLEMLCLAKRRGFGSFLEAPIHMEYFTKNTRPILREILHVAQISVSLMKDTFRLYWRLKHVDGAVHDRAKPIRDSREQAA